MAEDSMATLFSAEYSWVWALALTAALWLPVRQMVWVLAVRRAQAKGGAADEAEKLRLKRRAGFTAALVCFVFSVFYTNYLFSGSP